MPQPVIKRFPMRPVLLLSLGLLVFPGLSLLLSPKSAPACPSEHLQALPVFQQEVRPTGILYTFTVPADSPYTLSLGVSPSLAGIEAPDWQAAAGLKAPVFLINAGFFDPQNRQTTSYLSREGVVTDDPTRNARLMDNPKLAAYLPAILNRSEFRVYRCRPAQPSPVSAASPSVAAGAGRDKAESRETTRYDIAPHDAPIPESCRLQDAAGAGPLLLPRLTDKEEAFVDYDAHGRLIRDPIGVRVRNARSVIGLTGKGDVILMLGAQVPAKDNPTQTPPEETSVSSALKNRLGQDPLDETTTRHSTMDYPVKNGFTLPEMGAFLKARGAVKAMALDGGSSSGILYRDRAIYGKFNADGSPVKRPVKSVWMVIPL